MLPTEFLPEIELPQISGSKDQIPSPWNRIVTFSISSQVWAALGAVLFFTLALGVVLNLLARRCFRPTDGSAGAGEDQANIVLRPLWVVQALLIGCEFGAVIFSVIVLLE